MEDGRCRLGPGGRLALVRLIEQGSTLRAAGGLVGGGGGAPHRRAGHGPSVVASLVSGQRAGASVTGVSAGQTADPEVVSVAALARG
jgi:hypothetical protein